MSLNRNELRKKIKVVCSALLTEKGYISFVDIFMKLDYLSVDEYEAWRMKKHPCLEQVIHINLSKISFIMKEVRTLSRAGKLIESNTAYMSWGKGKKIPLRFSKSGKPAIEKLYSTHFLKRETERNRNCGRPRRPSGATSR